MGIIDSPRLLTCLNSGYRLAAAIALVLALVVTGARGPGGRSILAAQALDPCTLLTVDEIEPLAKNTDLTAGLPETFPEFGYATCRYVWGVGVGRFTLDVAINDPARMFPNLSPEQIKQRLLESVRAGTDDAVISEIGEAAVFKPQSPAYAGATAFVKGRILQVNIGGIFAGEKKDQLISLLKSAAARL